MYLLLQKFLVLLFTKLYVPVICFAISINEVYWNSGKSSQSTNWVVNAAIEFYRFNQTDTTGPNEIVLITGIRTAEFH